MGSSGSITQMEVERTQLFCTMERKTSQKERPANQAFNAKTTRGKAAHVKRRNSKKSAPRTP